MMHIEPGPLKLHCPNWSWHHLLQLPVYKHWLSDETMQDDLEKSTVSKERVLPGERLPPVGLPLPHYLPLLCRHLPQRRRGSTPAQQPLRQAGPAQGWAEREGALNLGSRQRAVCLAIIVAARLCRTSISAAERCAPPAAVTCAHRLHVGPPDLGPTTRKPSQHRAAPASLDAHLLCRPPPAPPAALPASRPHRPFLLLILQLLR